MPFLPSQAAPFGPLEPLHLHFLATAQTLTWTNFHQLFVYPLIPLYLQAVLLQLEGKTRRWRIALAVLGVTMMWRAGTSLRFTEPRFNALNNGIGIALLHLTARYIEFALLEGPVIDRYYQSKGRHWLISAMDVTVNARWIGLGSVDLDRRGKVSSEVGAIDSNGTGNGTGRSHGKSNGRADPAVSGPSQVKKLPDGGAVLDDHPVPLKVNEAWLPYPSVRRTRPQALLRHARIAITHWIMFDTLLALIRHFGASNIASLEYTPNSLYHFSHDQAFVFFPRSGLLHFVAPSWVVELAAELGVGSGVYIAIESMYHACAFVLVGLGLWEVESWEVDMFDSPLMADSLLDLWGKRWHQFFRHHFILVSTLLLRAVHLAPTSSSILFLSFFLSGGMHALGQFLMDPVPPLLPLWIFFIAAGIGCGLEVTWKRMTGNKVRGAWGRVWAYAWMLGTARWAVGAWLDIGIGGSALAPVGLGEWIKDGMVRWVVDTV